MIWNCCLLALLLALPVALVSACGFSLLVLEGWHRLAVALAIATAAITTLLCSIALQLAAIPASTLGAVAGFLHLGVAWVAAARADQRRIAGGDKHDHASIGAGRVERRAAERDQAGQ